MIKTSASYTGGGDVTELRYLLTTPTGFDPTKESLPMIVFLHGAGERGDDLELVKINGIPKYFAKDQDFGGTRVVTLSPQCPHDMTWNHLTAQLMRLIDIVASEINIDRDRIVLTGISMGGFGTWEMGMTYPGTFAALAPICGGGMAWRAGALAGVPIRVFHGTDDGLVSVEYSKMMVDAINSCGGTATLTLFDNVGHDAWTSAYETTDLIQWLANAKK